MCVHYDFDKATMRLSPPERTTAVQEVMHVGGGGEEKSQALPFLNMEKFLKKASS